MSSKLPLSLKFLVAGATMLAAAVAGSSDVEAAAYLDPSFWPNDPLFFYNKEKLPSFPGQWHLDNQAPETVGAMTGNAGLDANLAGAWKWGVVGRNVVIGIIDDGVEGEHEDLAPNYRADLSKMFSQNTVLAALEQRPYQLTDEHGIAVAGIAAARGGNGVGVTGAAPYAQIAGLRISFTYTADDPGVTLQDLQDAFLWKSGVTAGGVYEGEAEIHVKNNSWGGSMPFVGQDGTTFVRNSPEELALRYATANGTIFLFAAGNERGTYNENSATDPHSGAEAVITVAALGSNGVYSSYSNFGSNIFVTSPSSSTSREFSITTTDRSGPLGYNTYDPSETTDTTTDTAVLLTDIPNGNYTSTFGGTSAATPLVSGIIALGKQIAPTMDTRFAKHALVASSYRVDPYEKSNSSLQQGWVRNAAGNYFNPNYGFGLVDAEKFVHAVEDIAYVTDRTQANTGTIAVGKSIVVRNTAADDVVVTFSLPTDLLKQPIESVETRIKVSRPDGSTAAVWQDLQLTLTSPSGTTAGLLLFNDYVRNAVYADGTPASDVDKVAFVQAFNEYVPGFDWWFTANNFWGESAAGDWTLTASNRGFLSIGGVMTLDEFQVIINMGRAVLESDLDRMTIRDGDTVTATSLILDKGSFTVQSGGTFLVTDSINIYGGEAAIYGTVGETLPATSTGTSTGAGDTQGFNKPSKITVTGGGANDTDRGTLTIYSDGKVTATRGLEISGGYVALYGTLDLGAAGITVNYGGEFYSRKDLTLTGDLLLGDDPTTPLVYEDLPTSPSVFYINSAPEGGSPAGKLMARNITVGSGVLTVPTRIDAGTETVDENGAKAIAGGRLILTGGSIYTGKLTAAQVDVGIAAPVVVTDDKGNPVPILDVNGDPLLDDDGNVRYETKDYYLGGGTLSVGFLPADTGGKVAIEHDGVTPVLEVGGDINVLLGALDVRGKIVAKNIIITGQTDWTARGWFSPGGLAAIDTVSDPVSIVRVRRAEVVGNLTIAHNGVLLIDARNGERLNDGTLPILTDTLHVRGLFSYSGALYINRIKDAAGNYPQPVYANANDLKVSDTAKNNVKFTLVTIEPYDADGNRIVDADGLPVELPKLESGLEIDNSFAAITPTLRYRVYTDNWTRQDADGNYLDAAGNIIPQNAAGQFVDGNGDPLTEAQIAARLDVIANGRVYGILTRDYAPASAPLTPNQRSVGTMFNTLWTDYQVAKGWLKSGFQLGSVTTGTTVPYKQGYYTPALSVPALNEGILAHPQYDSEGYKIAISRDDTAGYWEQVDPNTGRVIKSATIDPDRDNYDFIYEDIFTAIDSVKTERDLATLYEQIAPSGNVVLANSLKQQLRAPVTAIRARSRDARGSFLQPGSLWSNPLFGGSYSYNFALPLIAALNNEFYPYTGHSVDYPVTFWFNGGASYTPGKSNNYTTGFDTFGYHAAVGLDYRADEIFAIGVTLGYSGVQTDFSTDGLKNESDSIFAALYITGAAGGWYYNASAGATINSYNFKRSTSVLGAANINAAGDAIGGNFRGKPDGNSFFASIETGYEWMHEGWAFGPYAGADYSTSNVDAYSDGPENTLSLHVDKQTIDSFTTRVGFRVNRTFNAAAVSIQPEIHAEWIHEFEDGKRNITSALNISGAQRFAIAANPNTKDYANTGLAVSFLISRQVTLTAEYDCTLFVNDVDPAHQASVTLRVSF